MRMKVLAIGLLAKIDTAAEIPPAARGGAAF
jgi:hypothetical protein